MRKDVAVVHEVPNVHATEIHAQRDAGIRSRSSPIGHLHHVQVLLLGRRDRHAVLLLQQEMDLVLMELVSFKGAVFDGLLFHRAVMGDDSGWIISIE